jgi:transcriptional regulator with XRE-family HTH domain
MSDFWKRVDEEIDFKGINRAYLARKCDFSVTNIGQGIKLGSVPSADTAVKIAQVLGVSVEYLVNGAEGAASKAKAEEEKQLMLYRKYSKLISKCEKLPSEQVNFLSQIADRLEK